MEVQSGDLSLGGSGVEVEEWSDEPYFQEIFDSLLSEPSDVAVTDPHHFSGNNLEREESKKDKGTGKRKFASSSILDETQKYMAMVKALFDTMNSGNTNALESQMEMFEPDLVVTETFVGDQPPGGEGIGKRIQGLSLYIQFLKETMDAIPDGICKIMGVRLRKKGGCNVLVCSYTFGGTQLGQVHVKKDEAEATVTTVHMNTPAFPKIRGTMSFIFNDKDRVQQIDLLQSFDQPDEKTKNPNAKKGRATR